MVEVKKLSELLEITDLNKRNVQLRKAFTAYSLPLDVTGNESETLTILLNLTYKRGHVDDLCNFDFAKATLKDTVHIESCLKEVKWLHTHNLKYPDIRVSNQRLLSKPLTLVPKAINSANFPKMLGWSHDSKAINFSKIIVSHFLWHNDLTCISRLIADENELWGRIFKRHGITLKEYQKLCKRVKTDLPDFHFPKSVDNHSVQIQLPYRNGYIAITPVLSHTIQSAIQQASRQKQGRYLYITQTRPSSVSELANSLGGNIAVFNYPPRISHQIQSYNIRNLNKVANGDEIFYHTVLSDSYFTRALDDLIYNERELTHQKRRRKKLSSYKRIRSVLAQWLNPIMQWRTELAINGGNITKLEEFSPLLYYLLTFQGKVNRQVFSDLFILFNNHLPNKYAFHPELISPLNGLLLGCVNKINNLFKLTEDMNNKQLGQRFLYIKDIQAFDAQALSNPYCLGIPSLTSVYGMTHNYQRRINEHLNTNIQLGSFAWYLRRYSAVTGVQLPEYTIKKSGTGPFLLQRPRIIDSKQCDINFDLIIKVYGRENDIDILINNKEKLMAAFPSKFAGGTMLPNATDERHDWCQFIQNEDMLYEELKRVPNFGQWVMPVSNNITSMSELLNFLEDDQQLAPVNSGFSFLEEPKARENSIERRHCYAEPLISLIRYTYAIDIKLGGFKKFINKAFWQVDAQRQYVKITKAN